MYWLTDNRDINNIHYDDSLIRMTGLDRSKLPDLVPTNSIIGNISKQIATGTDSTGKQTYQTVYAILNIQRQSFTARGQMDVNITDMNTRKNIGYNSYNDSFEWEEEKANYSGDSRALSSNDWALVNNNNFNMPRKEEILNQLYKRIYPQVKNKISYAVDW